MKEGAGEDPFADDSEPDEPTSEAGESADSVDTTDDSPAREEAESSQRQQSIQIPYKFRRNGVQDGRDRFPLFLQPETKRAERDALHELEDRFDDSVSLTDLREALMLVGLEHLDEVEENLESWGYGMTFE
jgi:hypothetical protein